MHNLAGEIWKRASNAVFPPSEVRVFQDYIISLRSAFMEIRLPRGSGFTPGLSFRAQQRTGCSPDVSIPGWVSPNASSGISSKESGTIGCSFGNYSASG